jgi:hypothetical protein
VIPRLGELRCVTPRYIEGPPPRGVQSPSHLLAQFGECGFRQQPRQFRVVEAAAADRLDDPIVDAGFEQQEPAASLPSGRAHARERCRLIPPGPPASPSRRPSRCWAPRSQSSACTGAASPPERHYTIRQISAQGQRGADGAILTGDKAAAAPSTLVMPVAIAIR